MALKLAGYPILLVLLVWGNAPHGVNSLIFQNDTSALFNSGGNHGDTETSDVLNPVTVNLDFSISYLGFNYNKLYISADGTVGFQKEAKYLEGVYYSKGVKNPETDIPFIAPLLHKAYRNYVIDSSQYHGKIGYRALNFLASTAIDQENMQLREYLQTFLPSSLINAPDSIRLNYLVVVTWSDLAGGTETGPCIRASPCNSTSFQLVLTGNDVNTYAIFNYGKVNITIQDNSEAGFNAGSGRGWYNVLPCHGGCGTSAIKGLPSFQGSERNGRYIFSVGQEAVIRGGCLSSELQAGILEVYPRTVGMFGGERLEVSGLCSYPSAKIYCRFGAASQPVNRTVLGAMVTTMKGYCPVPLLSITGRIDIYWSNDNILWRAYQSINVVLPTRLVEPVVIDQSVKEAWYKRDSREITVKWDPARFSKVAAVNVEIKVIGYREQGNQIEYRELRNVGTTENSKGSYTFGVEGNQCTQDCEQFEIGLLEVSLPAQYHGSASERVAVRFGPIPLGWYVNQDLSAKRGSDWSDQKCKEWRQEDGRDTQWINDLLPCPCSLNQALADFGRWQADPGCNLFTGSSCLFHKGAKHCVRAVDPTPKDGAGNQCCYNQDGTLRYSQLSPEGSTPDRSHAWGASPYNVPGRVPELSHWRHDVVSFFYCCLWNNYNLCDLYMEQRPTTDCRNYDVPGIGFIYGNTHIRTVDGLSYNFVEFGDFWLAEYKDVSLIVQGKFEPRVGSWDLGDKFNKKSWKPSALTSLGLSSGTIKIEVSVSAAAVNQRRGLDIKVDDEVKYFLDQASFWQDFQEFTVINNAKNITNNHHDNFTILLHKFSVGVNVASFNNLLYVTVAVPPSYKVTSGSRALVAGLLGAFDGIASNDFQSRQGEVIPATDRNAVLERFALSWMRKPEDYEIFRFESTANDKLDSVFTFLGYDQIPSNFTGSPGLAIVNNFCGTSDNCKWDYLITGDVTVARATKEADYWIANLQRSATRVDNCGLPMVGAYTVLSSENFTVGMEVKVTGCSHGKSLQTSATYRCQQDGDTRKWVPTPKVACSGTASSDSSNLALIIGVSVGVAVAIIIIVVIIVIVVRRRKTGSGETTPKETPTPASRERREVVRDPAAAEAMLSTVEDRSPVYKPSAEPVRMSELHGSNV